MAELPAVVESLAGVDIRRLVDAIPALQASTAEVSENPPAQKKPKPEK
jgi:hypothetical protein